MNKKKLFLFIALGLAVLAVVFGILYLSNENNDEKAYYLDEYLEARNNIRESEALIEEMEATGLPFHSEIYSLELAIDTFEEWSSTCWEEVQQYNRRATTFIILALVSLAGSIGCVVISKKTKTQEKQNGHTSQYHT